MPDWITHEPAIWMGLVNAVIILLIAFGIPITNDQKVAVGGFFEAVLVILGAVIVRQNVTPLAKTGG